VNVCNISSCGVLHFDGARCQVQHFIFILCQSLFLWLPAWWGKGGSLCDWQFTANQFILAPSPLRLMARFFFQLNSCGHSPYVTSSLTRGWVCRLQLLLFLACTFSGPSPSGLMATFYCLTFKTPPTWRPGPSIYVLPEKGSPVMPPGTGFPFHRLLQLAGLQWRWSEHASTPWRASWRINLRRTEYKTPLITVYI
jgi:hypothetical protein